MVGNALLKIRSTDRWQVLRIVNCSYVLLALCDHCTSQEMIYVKVLTFSLFAQGGTDILSDC